ncbi:MAG: DNA polymerase IV [Planctomycetes bacterium]|nr:DNA polymerase IV [Planctomycetota bacterium]
MDAFYASVEQRDHPDLRGKPVIVGGSPESRGVVSAASYEARRFGVHSAMPAAHAKRLCPHAVFLPVRMQRYQEVSARIRSIFESFTPLVEPLSLDEAFLDVTGSIRLFGPAAEIGRQIKEMVRQQTDLTVSIGIGPNMFLAKLASGYQKPDGFLEIREEEKLAFLEPLDVTRLWGVGEATAQVLHESGVRTIGHLRNVPLSVLRSKLGKTADFLLELAHGEDAREVVPDAEAKSLGSESTYPEDVSDIESLETTALEHAEQVAFRVRSARLQARTVTLKLKFADFSLSTRSRTLADATDRTDVIAGTALALLRRHDAARSRPVRLVGVSVSQLSAASERQASLFGREEEERRRSLDRAVDEIRSKMGEDSIKRGRLL